MKRFSLKTSMQSIACVGFFLMAFVTVSFAADLKGVPVAPIPGMVTMVDLGAKKCVPCKMMAPIMEELEKEYQDRAAVIFIDVWEYPDAGKKYGISVIPTQIFYDASGKEMLRHEGFYDKAAIIAELTKLGVN
ncbi:thioredoxin family protein [Rhodopseudomonas palustris]|nr:thioredoxin family protein [Rhodopseudomonas palustris]